MRPAVIPVRVPRIAGSILALLLAASAGATPWQERPRQAELLVTEAVGGDPALRPREITRGALRIAYRERGAELSVDDLEYPGKVHATPTRSASSPAFFGNCLVLTEFDFSSRNRLGGGYRTFARSPARFAAALAGDSTGHRYLRLDYNRPGDRHAGIAFELHDPDADADTVYYLDASRFDVLTFWVRGATANASIRVALSDAAAVDRDESVEIGTLGVLTEPGPAEWRLATVRLDDLPEQIDRRQLAKLVLLADPGTSGQIDIDRPAVCRDDAPTVPLRPAWPVRNSPPPGKSLWVWHTKDLAGSATQTDALGTFVDTEEIGLVYLQVPGELLRSEPDIDAAVTKLAPIVRRITAGGAQVFALDGAPKYAQRDHHADVLAGVRAIDRYNERVPPESRFSGIHYDIEPYLLPEFGDDRRPTLVKEFLQLLELLHTTLTNADMTLEVAIPFWFDSVRVRDPISGDRPLAELIIDRADRVAIMDYRTQAGGSNGAVALAEHELVYASEVGKQVMVGLETTTLPDEELLHFRGEGQRGMPEGLNQDGWVIAGMSGDRLIFIAVPGGQESTMAGSIAALDLELEQVRNWRISRRSLQPATRLTFANLGPNALREVMRETRDAVGEMPAFAGFAIHYHQAYLRMMARFADPQATATAH